MFGGWCRRQDPSPILRTVPYPELSPSHHRLSLPLGQEQKEWSKPRSLLWGEEPWAAETGSPAIVGLAGVRGHGKGTARLSSSSSARPGEDGREDGCRRGSHFQPGGGRKGRKWEAIGMLPGQREDKSSPW